MILQAERRSLPSCVSARSHSAIVRAHGFGQGEVFSAGRYYDMINLSFIDRPVSRNQLWAVRVRSEPEWGTPLGGGRYLQVAYIMR